MRWAITVGLLALLPERWALALDRELFVPAGRGL